MTLLVAAAAAFPAARAAAQGASAPALKAAFVFNFVQFTQWPGDVLPAGAPLNLCVLGDSQVLAALEAVTHGQPVDSHDLVVKAVSAGGPVHHCHLLYVSGIDSRQTNALVQALGDTPALTVSDLSGFATSGGIVNFVVENEKLRFVINVDAASRARVRLSSKLLSLARIIKH